MAQPNAQQQLLSNHSELLEEFDPFHTPPEATSRQPSPQLFPTSQPPQPSSSTSSTPNSPPSLPSTAVSSDPLDSFDLLSFSDQPPPPQRTSSSTAHAARQQHVLDSLSRSPFSTEPTEFPSSSSASSAPVPGPPLHRRASSSFSPPRRLSLLMQDSFSPSSPPPTVSHPSLSPFHAPPPEPHAAEAYARRTASHEAPPHRAEPSHEFDEEGEDWGEFESGAVEKRKELKRTKTVPVPTVRRARGDEAGWKKEWSYDSKGADAVQPIKLVGVMPGVNRILDEDLAEGVRFASFRCEDEELTVCTQIRPGLPPRYRLSTTWTLLYSLDQHGISIQTMYERMRVGLRGSDSGVVLVVKDGEGNVFGAYVNEGLKESRSYYGDGTWCVCFHLAPRASRTNERQPQLPLESEPLPSLRLPCRILDQILQMDGQERLPRPLGILVPLGRWRRRAVRTLDRRGF